MIRIGMLGADSSHAETYIGLVNHPTATFHGRARVTKLWGQNRAQAEAKAGSDVEVVSQPEDASSGVDLVMICARWGTDHYALMRTALEAGDVPVYVDKPFTNSLPEALDLLARVRSAGVPCFSCSPYRFALEVSEAQRAAGGLGHLRSGFCAGLSEWSDFGQPGREIYFYGVHVAEMLQAVFGPGFDRVFVASSESVDVVTVACCDGRRLGVHLLRNCQEVFQVSYIGEKGSFVRQVGGVGMYESLLEKIVTMAETGSAPIPVEHAVEIVSLLDAVDRCRAAASPAWVPLTWRNPIAC